MPDISSYVSSRYIFLLQGEKHTISLTTLTKYVKFVLQHKRAPSNATFERKMVNEREK